MKKYVFDANSYRKNIQKNTFAFFPVIIVIIIILIGIILMVNVKDKTLKKYYFLQINSFNNYSQANDLAIELQAKNSGGYVYFDNKYHVFASFYPTKKQAESVKNNIISMYPKVEIYSLEFEKFIHKSYLTKKQNNTTIDLCEAIETNIINLYDLSLQYETNQISKEVFKIKLQKEIEDFSNLKTELFSILNKPKFTNNKKPIENISRSFDKILTSFDSESLVQIIRIETIDIVLNYSSFCSSF